MQAFKGTLQLIAIHMAATIATNIKAALKDLNIRSVTEWTDSSVTLHCLRDQGLQSICREQS